MVGHLYGLDVLAVELEYLVIRVVSLASLKHALVIQYYRHCRCINTALMTAAAVNDSSR